MAPVSLDGVAHIRFLLVPKGPAAAATTQQVFACRAGHERNVRMPPPGRLPDPLISACSMRPSPSIAAVAAWRCAAAAGVRGRGLVQVGGCWMGPRAHPLWVQPVCGVPEHLGEAGTRLFHTQHPACPQDTCHTPHQPCTRERSGATACSVQAPLQVLALACSRHRCGCCCVARGCTALCSASCARRTRVFVAFGSGYRVGFGQNAKRGQRGQGSMCANAGRPGVHA